MKLSEEHIKYIIKDLHHRGIVAGGIEEELIDHVCSGVEDRIMKGARFIVAYQEVLKTFGQVRGLRETQKETLESINKKTNIMLKNYITIAFRNLRKHRFYTLINILGLAIGVASCLIIVLFIADEMSYDKYNVNANRIYRLHNEIKFGGNHMHIATTSAPAAHAMQQDYPEIEATVRFRTYGSYLVKPSDGTENIKEENVAWTDSTFFKVFSVKVLEGNPNTALKQPASVAISKRMADKYFPGKSALGQPLILDNKRNAKVTAVYETIPVASHFHFDILIAMVGDWPVAKEAQSPVFLNNNFVTYLLLKEGADAKAFQAKLPGFLQKYVGPQIAQLLGGEFTMEKFQESGNKYEITLMPLTDIHLRSSIKGEFEPNGNITYVYLLAAVALLILVVACINFMNLSTARSANRAKEVGVRKVMGSLRSHLVRQFLMESALVTLFAFVLAIGIAYLALPIFNNLSLKQLQLPFASGTFYIMLFTTAILIGIFAGAYPAFFLSAFKPVQVLKGHLSIGMKSGFIRSALVVFQFMISILLLIGAISVNRQLAYIQTKKLGFEKDQVIVIHDTYALRPNNVLPFKNEVLRNPSIQSGTISSHLPVEGTARNDNPFWKEGNRPTTENMVSMQNWNVDADYLATLGMKVKAGRGFSAEFPSDSSAVILNEEALKHFNLGEVPIGSKISTFDGKRPDGSPDPDQSRSWTVIGVVENFHFSSLKEGVTSLGLFLGNSDNSVSFRFTAGDTKEIIGTIEKIWKELAPGQPFMYSFLDDDFGTMYAAEERLGKIFTAFATLAIIIACLGLFALTSFTAEQRTKEIGIRKVMGASVQSIVFLLSKEFAKLIIIAFAIAAPVAWYGIDWWLNSYTYRTEIGVLIYAIAGLAALLIAWFTMGYQSFKAATADPVQSLRNE